MFKPMPIDRYAPESPRPEPVVDRVARMLRTAILNGDLKPGERIRQEAVAEAARTSRIPVREALRELAMEGLVTLEPNVGARVARLDRAELEEVFLMRERLEPLAITVSGPKLTAADIEGLRRMIAEMDALANAEGFAEWLRISREFHMATYSAAGMPRLLTLISGLWDTLDRYRRVYFGGEQAIVQSPVLEQAEHRLVFEALERGDAVGAGYLTEIHIRRARLTLTAK